MSRIRELREQIDARRKQLEAVFAEAKTTDGDGRTTYDFGQVKSLDVGNVSDAGRATAVSERVVAITRELDELQDKYTSLKSAEDAARAFDERSREVETPTLPTSGRKEAEDERIWSMHEVSRHITREHKDAIEAWARGDIGHQVLVEKAGIESLLGYKATMTTSAGFPPESTRIGATVDIPLQPIRVIDIMPRGNTSQNSVVYMQQSVRTAGAAEVAEAGLPGESTLTWTEASVAVVEIADSIPVTNIQLEDAPQVASIIEQQLGEQVRARLDGQVLNGNGTAPNLRGILNTTGILTQAKGVDPVFDAIHKAVTNIRTGAQKALATHVLMHPADWQTLRLTQTADGAYVLGSPADTATPRIWGLPVVQTEQLTAGTALVGEFTARSVMLFTRRGLTVSSGLSNDDFLRGKKTLRASLRGALAVFRPAAFSTVTGL